MSDLRKVTGYDCLNWINKPIGFCNKETSNSNVNYYANNDNWLNTEITTASYVQYGKHFIWRDAVKISRFPHDITKRIVGHVRKKYADGGYEVSILGDEQFTNLSGYNHLLYLHGCTSYHWEQISISEGVFQQNPYIGAPIYGSEGSGVNVDNSKCYLQTGASGIGPIVPFYDTIDYTINSDDFDGSNMLAFDRSLMTYGMLTNNPNTSLIFGKGLENLSGVYMRPEFFNDPLKYLQGALYDLFNEKSLELFGRCPYRFTDLQQFATFTVNTGEEMASMNLVSIPYNIILTESLQQAQAYLSNGTLPDDAFLFPLDWELLPTYDQDDRPDDDTDGDDDDDNKHGFDGDPDLPIAPSFTPNRLTNNNYYWLTNYQLEGFINWFWNDVGSMSDFDDIINKVKGLYNDLASSVLMIRYMPVNINWIGGQGSDHNIITGMIEKSGAVPTIAKANPPIIDIGHVKVPKDFNSFASYSPYSSCSLYLPYHGFLDIDMDMFTGHDLYVKAIYDHMSGTIQYLIYYENEFLVNSVVCKMAVDIPITLQSKNDRDSAIFQNVSSSIAGLMSAGTTLATGNPIGLVVGASALTSGIHSAPMQVKGTIGETGAFYAPSKCKLIARFPTQQKPSKFGQFCGKQLNKTMKLNNSDLAGLTICYNPKITFKKTTPLESEIQEIYDLLEKGVIL